MRVMSNAPEPRAPMFGRIKRAARGNFAPGTRFQRGVHHEFGHPHCEESTERALHLAAAAAAAVRQRRTAFFCIHVCHRCGGAECSY